jgi:predicted DsbA family dithiol-disulfide isomerase
VAAWYAMESRQLGKEGGKSTGLPGCTIGSMAKIDFVSDVSCPWCAIGLASLLIALKNLGRTTENLHFEPFELNPDMGPRGEDIAEHIARKYGSSAQQFAQSQEMIRARGAELGFRFDMHRRTRIYNTFDAHRLLHWAGIEGRQLELKQALFAGYFQEGVDVSDHGVLTQIAGQVGLDGAVAREVLESDRFASDVRAREQFYHSRGINAVPAIIINDRHLIEGGQPVAVFEKLLRQLAASGTQA